MDIESADRKFNLRLDEMLNAKEANHMERDYYVLYSYDYSGESSCHIFSERRVAHQKMEEDVENVIRILKEDGHEYDVSIHRRDASVDIPDTEVHYEWKILKAERYNNC